MRSGAGGRRSSTPTRLDLDAADKRASPPRCCDRLRLDDTRLRGIVDALRQIAEQKDPVGRILAEWDRPNGLHIQRVATPLGVVGVIYESRPNVTADAGALCLKSGNAVILRGGSRKLRDLARPSTPACSTACESRQPARRRDPVHPDPRPRDGDGHAAGHRNTSTSSSPAAARALSASSSARRGCPVFAHLEGICHVYADRDADLEKARRVVLNAKTRRTGICGSAECLLIDWQFYTKHGAVLIEDLLKAGVEVRTEGELLKIPGTVKAATR